MRRRLTFDSSGTGENVVASAIGGPLAALRRLDSEDVRTRVDVSPPISHRSVTDHGRRQLMPEPNWYPYGPDQAFVGSRLRGRGRAVRGRRVDVPRTAAFGQRGAAGVVR